MTEEEKAKLIIKRQVDYWCNSACCYGTTEGGPSDLCRRAHPNCGLREQIDTLNLKLFLTRLEKKGGV